MSVGKTNLLLRNLLRTPILELEAANINLGELEHDLRLVSGAVSAAAIDDTCSCCEPIVMLSCQHSCDRRLHPPTAFHPSVAGQCEPQAAKPLDAVLATHDFTAPACCHGLQVSHRRPVVCGAALPTSLPAFGATTSPWSSGNRSWSRGNCYCTWM
eukprot:GHUV01033958.1.p2 GENE.GHUV01033958.1~~GHUV01033958.1.p2  ORF type:complete len:156 (-),score=34.20 GHUV01033958.1:165-632(-)